MSYKYCCDECGADLSESDHVAMQLDIYGKAYCHECFSKQPKTTTMVYTKTNTYGKLEQEKR